LTRKSGGYEATLRARVLTPLGMTDTGVVLSPGQTARLATGHGRDLAPTSNWTMTDALAGAGGIRSTANDMARYLRAAAGWESTPLAAAFKLAETPVTTARPNLEVGLGWHVTQSAERTMVWHNGRTGGYASMLVFDANTREGVVVLANASISVDDLAIHLVDPTRKLAEPPRERTAIKVDPALYDRLAGRYELAPTFVVTVSRDGDRIFAQATAQPKYEIFPEAELDYFYNVVDAQLSFRRDGDGKVTGVVLHQGGRDTLGKRLD
jgi:CubicO group peptidase (beta-lactamase class C family)